MFVDLPISEAPLPRGWSFEADYAMTPAALAVTPSAFSGMGGVGNAVVWSPFTRSPAVLFLDLQ